MPDLSGSHPNSLAMHARMRPVTTSERTGTPADTPRPVGPVVLAVLAAAAHLLAGAFYLASGLVAPMWAIVLLLLWWLVLAGWLVQLARRRSWWTPAPPAIAVITWFAAITAGEQLLGWTG